MASVVRTPEAKRDLRQIVRFISRDKLSAASNWLETIKRCFRTLASQPGLGELLGSHHRGEVRRHAFGNYVIYYRPFNGGIEVLRVLHGARDPGRPL
jgi:toxin ParE1/3/4